VGLGGGGGVGGDGDGEGAGYERNGAGAGGGQGNRNGNGTVGEDKDKDKDKDTLLVYHPLRDALRKELVIYAGLVEPPLTDLIQAHKQDDGAVVSHKDLSIEEVMTRYFAEVEESYPSVVANVARTTGKLVRAGEQSGESCGLCGMPLDEDGDERWRGELGIQKGSGAGTGSGLGRLCYGCERSTAG
jgi:cytoplasmic tRNA 2-thiolation protein 2